MNTIAIIGTAIILFVGYSFLKPKQIGSFKNINSKDAKIMLAEGKAIALDVRTPMEIKSGKIKQAKIANVADTNFVSNIKKLDPEKTYIVYCRSGRRSVKACNIMYKNGFHNLYNLEGGYNAWK